jgi:hypothetical protein
VVIEAGVVAGYVIAWATRKARRAAGRIDDEADAIIDAGLDRLNEIVMARLAGHPALAGLDAEAAAAALDHGQEVSELTRQEVEWALATAARDDRAFWQAVTELATGVREAQRAARRAPSRQATVAFSGDARADASYGGIAFSQVAGDVQITREPGDPRRPGRSGH